MRWVFGCGLLLAGLALAGCGGGTSGVPAGAAPSPSRATSAPPARPSGATRPPPASPTAGGVLVEFDRQGGLAGVSDQLSVGRDGGFTLVRGRPVVQRSGRLTATELADLRQALDRSNFTTLPGVESGSGSDRFTYHVTYAGSQILAQDGGVAGSLRPVIDALTAIVQKYGS